MCVCSPEPQVFCTTTSACLLLVCVHTFCHVIHLHARPLAKLDWCTRFCTLARALFTCPARRPPSVRPFHLPAPHGNYFRSRRPPLTHASTCCALILILYTRHSGNLHEHSLHSHGVPQQPCARFEITARVCVFGL